MAEVKLTKNELRAQQGKLKQLRRYLPTLQLKKAMLQAEVNDVRQEIVSLQAGFKTHYDAVHGYSQLLSEKAWIDLVALSKVAEIRKRWENIAGVEIPFFEEAVFPPTEYNLLDTPPWVDSALLGLRTLSESQAKVAVAKEKKEALEKELREVSIRVNLFEKVLIPRAEKNIKKIRVFLGDQQLAAVSQAKVAKTKIELKKEQSLAERGVQ